MHICGNRKNGELKKSSFYALDIIWRLLNIHRKTILFFLKRIFLYLAQKEDYIKFFCELEEELGLLRLGQHISVADQGDYKACELCRLSITKRPFVNLEDIIEIGSARQKFENWNDEKSKHGIILENFI